MKRILFGLLVALLASFAGCKYEETYLNPCNSSQCTTSSSFNQESYVWEYIFFPTNRTSGAQ